jgi:hypothetical protein
MGKASPLPPSMGESMRPIEGSGLQHESALVLLRPRPWAPEDQVVITVDLHEEPCDTKAELDDKAPLPDALHGMYYLG